MNKLILMIKERCFMKNIIEKQNLNNLLSTLIKIPSPYFEEEKIMEYACSWLKQRNVPAQIHRYHEKEITNFEGMNVIGTIDSGKEGPVIYFNGHLDTVRLCSGWTQPPYDAVVKDGNMYGVGALDMKSGCAIIMEVLAEFVKNVSDFRGKIIYNLVSDEEGPFGLGTTYLINDKKIQMADLAIITEPSAGFARVKSPSISLGARGGYNYKVKLYGKSSHAAAPELGINALLDAAKLACELEKTEMKEDEKLGKGSHCLIGMSGGGQSCSVPDYAEIEVFRHIVRGEGIDTIKEEIHEAAKRADLTSKYKIELRSSPAENFDGGFEPYVIDENNKYLDMLKKSINKVCGEDASITYFKSMGDFNYIGGKLSIPTVIFGPEGENYHGSDEYVNLDSVWETAQSIYDFLVCTLSQD